MPSWFGRFGNLSFINQFSNIYRLASTPSDRKGAKIWHEFSWFYQNIFFSKHQNKVKFKNLDDTEVLNRDFPDLKTSEASMTSTTSTASVASMTSAASFHQNFYSTWCWTIPSTQMTSTSPFLWNGLSKIQFFTDIWYPFCRRLLRPAYVTFLKTGWWNSNFQTSQTH